MGTSGNDTFVAVAATTGATFNAADTLDGGAGTDTLNLTIDALAANSVPAASAQNIEVINVRNVSGNDQTVSGNNFVGHTQIWADRSVNDLTVDDLAAGAAVGVRGNNVVANGNVDFEYAAGARESITIAIDGGTKAASAANAVITNGDGTAKTATISSTGAANQVGNVVLSGADTVETLTINAGTNFETKGAISGFSSAADKGTINVTGAAASVKLGALNTNVIKVDASGLSAGGLTVDLNDKTNLQFIGGAGADTVTTGAVINHTGAAATIGSINGGAGTDTLIVKDAAHITANSGKQYSNFEVLQAENAVSVDLDHLAANNTITSVVVNQGLGATGFTNLSAAQAANVTIKGTGVGVVTLGVKGATNPGQIDTVKVRVDDGATAVATVTLTTPAIAGVENLELTAIENVTINALTGATSITNLKGFGTGNFNITTGAVDFAANTVFDFSAASGTVTLNAAAAQAGGASVGLSITGSATKANSITGSQKADVITGGAGNDTITGGLGNDVINIGNGGSDTVVFAATAANNGNDTINGFNVGATASGGDVLNLSAFLGGGTFGQLISANPGAPLTLAGGSVTRLVDIEGGQDIGTAAGLLTAIDAGGEFANIDLTDGENYVFLTAANATATQFKVFYAAGGATDAAATVTLVGTVNADAALAGLVAANLVL